MLLFIYLKFVNTFQKEPSIQHALPNFSGILGTDLQLIIVKVS